MRFQKAWFWVAILGLVALFVVSLRIEEPVQRAILSIATVLPLLYLTFQVTMVAQEKAAHERRRYVKLRSAADEFLMHVRNLNRLAVISKSDEAPDDADSMMEDVTQRMHGLIDRLKEVAGEESSDDGATD